MAIITFFHRSFILIYLTEAIQGLACTESGQRAHTTTCNRDSLLRLWWGERVRFHKELAVASALSLRYYTGRWSKILPLSDVCLTASWVNDRTTFLVDGAGDIWEIEFHSTVIMDWWVALILTRVARMWLGTWSYSTNPLLSTRWSWSSHGWMRENTAITWNSISCLVELVSDGNFWIIYQWLANVLIVDLIIFRDV